MGQRPAIRRVALLALVVACLTLAPAPLVIAFENQPPSLGLHEEAGVLSDAARQDISRLIERLHAAGAPTVVYLRIMDSTEGMTIRDGEVLMDQWEVESTIGARDGIVLFLNLDTADHNRGYLALIVGESHFRGGALPQAEIDRIHDRMIGRLAVNDMAGGLRLGLELLEERLVAGPPVQPAHIRIMQRIASGPISFISALAVVVAGTMGVVTARVVSNRPRAGNVWEQSTTRCPNALHPAFAGALVNGRAQWTHVEAALIELARRGALAIEPSPANPRDVQLRLLDPSVAEWSFEKSLLRIASEMAQDGVIQPHHLPQFFNRWGEPRLQIERELEANRLFNPDAPRLRTPLDRMFPVGLALGVGIVIASTVTETPWALPAAGIIALTGMATASMERFIPNTTVEGEKEAVLWRGYRRGLDEARKHQYGAIDLDEAFPYIVSLELTDRFRAHFEEASKAGYIPHWLGRPPITQRSATREPWTRSWGSYRRAVRVSRGSGSRGRGGRSSRGRASRGSGRRGGRF